MANQNSKINLKKLRKEIDKIDRALLKILAKRFKITRKIGFYKKANKLKIQDKKREKEILKERIHLSRKLNLDQNLVEKIFKQIFKKVVEENKK
jgi:chorismate mutase